MDYWLEWDWELNLHTFHQNLLVHRCIFCLFFQKRLFCFLRTAKNFTNDLCLWGSSPSTLSDLVADKQLWTQLALGVGKLLGQEGKQASHFNALLHNTRRELLFHPTIV